MNKLLAGSCTLFCAISEDWLSTSIRLWTGFFAHRVNPEPPAKLQPPLAVSEYSLIVYAVKEYSFIDINWRRKMGWSLPFIFHFYIDALFRFGYRGRTRIHRWEDGATGGMVGMMCPVTMREIRSGASA